MYPVQSSVFIEDEKHYLGHYYVVNNVYYAHVELINGSERKSANGSGDNQELAIYDGVQKIKEDTE